MSLSHQPTVGVHFFSMTADAPDQNSDWKLLVALAVGAAAMIALSFVNSHRVEAPNTAPPVQQSSTNKAPPQ